MHDLFTENGEINESLIVGTIEVGDGELFIVDLGKCSPGESFFQFRTVTENYKGQELTFATESFENVRI